MRILALDIGSTIGFARIDNMGTPDCSVGTFGQKRLGGDRAKRFFLLRRWLVKRLRMDIVDTVIFERPFCRGIHATRSLWGMAGIIEEVALGQGCACLDIVPSQIKKRGTGFGNAKKPELIAAAEKLLTLAGWADIHLGEHEADAIILGLYAAENITTGD